MKMKTTRTIAGKALASSALALALVMSSCSSKDNPTPTDGGGGNNNDVVVLQGDISTRTLNASKKYLIKGQVFVRNGQTWNELTICRFYWSNSTCR